jgi:hypothetical protein
LSSRLPTSDRCMTPGGNRWSSGLGAKRILVG